MTRETREEKLQARLEKAREAQRTLRNGFWIACLIIAILIAVIVLLIVKKPTTVTVTQTVETPVEVQVPVITEVVKPSGAAAYTLHLDDYANHFTAQTVEKLGRAIWGEASCVHSTTERAAVAWVILNQVDSDADGMRNYHSVDDVLANPDNIQGYWDQINSGPVPTEFTEIAYDVLCRYYAEQDGWTSAAVGRIIPSDYLYWMGDGISHNYFTIGYHNGKLNYCKTNAWDWSLYSPYED